MKRLIIAPCPKPLIDRDRRTGTAPGKAGIRSLMLATYLWAVVMALGVWDYYILRPTESVHRFPPSNIPKPYRALYHEMLAPVVKVVSPQGTGSGVIIDLECINCVNAATTQSLHSIFILTAAHVVGNESTVTVYIYDYELPVVTIETATVIITDTNKDLALLHTPNPSSRGEVTSPLQRRGGWGCVAKLAPRDYTPHLFTEVYAVGCSLGLNPRPSEGIITSIGINRWEISAPVLPGNSGGGVFLKDTHELIGITVWVRTYRWQLITTMAGIVPINQIYEFLSRMNLPTKESLRDPEVKPKWQLHSGDKTPSVNCEEHKHWGQLLVRLGFPDVTSGDRGPGGPTLLMSPLRRPAEEAWKGGEKSCHKR